MRILACIAYVIFFVGHQAIAAGPWLYPNAFDGADHEGYPFLKSISSDEGSFRCIDVSLWKDSDDPNLKQIYLQALESEAQPYQRLTYSTHEACKAWHHRMSQFGIPAVCVSSGLKYGFDYVSSECVQIHQDCGPGMRMRNDEVPERVFLVHFENKKSCEAAKRETYDVPVQALVKKKARKAPPSGQWEINSLE